MRTVAVWICDEHSMSINKACCGAAVVSGWIELCSVEEERVAELNDAEQAE